MPNKLSKNKVDDVIINNFISLNMIDMQSIKYSKPISFFGLTERLIKDCYTLKWNKHEYEYDLDNNLIHLQYDIIDYEREKDNINNKNILPKK